MRLRRVFREAGNRALGEASVVHNGHRWMARIHARPMPINGQELILRTVYAGYSPSSRPVTTWPPTAPVDTDVLMYWQLDRFVTVRRMFVRELRMLKHAAMVGVVGP